MKIADKRKAGEVLGRSGISQRIITIANEIIQGSYKGAIENAGRIAELVDCATFDEYWNEKASIGRQSEQGILEAIAGGSVSVDVAICKVRPWDKD